MSKRTLLGLAAGAAGVAAYALVVRPWHLRWGASDAELRLPFPDEVPHAPKPSVSAPHAVTIHAPAAEVCKWLVQIGQDRGGFYSYAWLEKWAATSGTPAASPRSRRIGPATPSPPLSNALDRPRSNLGGTRIDRPNDLGSSPRASGSFPAVVALGALRFPGSGSPPHPFRRYLQEFLARQRTLGLKEMLCNNLWKDHLLSSKTGG